MVGAVVVSGYRGRGGVGGGGLPWGRRRSDGECPWLVWKFYRSEAAVAAVVVVVLLLLVLLGGRGCGCGCWWWFASWETLAGRTLCALWGERG